MAMIHCIVQHDDGHWAMCSWSDEQPRSPLRPLCDCRHDTASAAVACSIALAQLPAYLRDDDGQRCELCYGTGRKPFQGGSVHCSDCRGTGRIIEPPDDRVLGRKAYQAYCDATGGISLVSRAPLPAWHDLRPDIRQAWIAAAAAIRGAL